jgi:hypothetical protein
VIGSAAAGAYDEFAGYAAVAYPASYLWYCTSFDSARYSQMARSTKPKLYVWGKTDVFAGDAAMEKLYDSLPEPRQKLVLEQLDDTLG